MITSRKITQFFGETEKICSIVSSLNIQFQALKSHHVKISLDFEFLNCQELNQNIFSNSLRVMSSALFAISTIIFIIVWDILMLCQIFLLPQVKRKVIISNKYDIYELPNDFRLDISKKLGNIRKISNLHRIIGWRSVVLSKWRFCQY